MSKPFSVLTRFKGANVFIGKKDWTKDNYVSTHFIRRHFHPCNTFSVTSFVLGKPKADIEKSIPETHAATNVRNLMLHIEGVLLYLKNSKGMSDGADKNGSANQVAHLTLGFHVQLNFT